MFVASDEATEAQQPREKALDVPLPPIPAQRSTVLSRNPLRDSVGRDHFDSQASHFAIERVAVVGAIADQSPGYSSYESVLDCGDRELRFMSLTTRNPDGDRKTVAVCHCHDLGRLAASSCSNSRAPFFAPAWEPSMNASVRSSLPRFSRSCAIAWRILSITLPRTHAWKRRWQVADGGYLLGRSAHGAPVRSTQRMPFNTSLGSRHGRPPCGPVRSNSGPGTNFLIASHCLSVRSTNQRQTSLSSNGKRIVDYGAISIPYATRVLRCALEHIS